MLLVRTPGPQAQLQPCASVDTAPILLHLVPGNACFSQPGQRTPACGCHSGAAVLLLVDESGYAGPLGQHLLSGVVCSFCSSPSAKRDIGGEVPRTGERSDAASVGADVSRPWGGLGDPPSNSPPTSKRGQELGTGVF